MAGKNNSVIPSGKVIYNSSIVRSIIELAIPKVEGVVNNFQSNNSSKNYIKLEFLENFKVSVAVSVTIYYGYNITDVANNIQQSIKNNVEAMSEYKVDAIDVHVVDVIFDEGDHD